MNKIKKIIKKFALTFIVLTTISVTIMFKYNMFPSFADSGFDISGDSGGDFGVDFDSSSYSFKDFKLESLPIVLFGYGGFFLIFLALAYVLDKINKKAIHNKAKKTEKKYLNQIKQYIPNFDNKEFVNQCYFKYVKIQEAWMNNRIDDVKDYLTDELYSMYKTQLEILEDAGQQNIMKDFELENGSISNVEFQNNTITITVQFIINLRDYIIDKNTKKCVRGGTRKLDVYYDMKFRKSLDLSEKITKCPSCGADIQMNSTGICSNCKQKIVIENTDWVLSEKMVTYQGYRYFGGIIVK